MTSGATSLTPWLETADAARRAIAPRTTTGAKPRESRPACAVISSARGVSAAADGRTHLGRLHLERRHLPGSRPNVLEDEHQSDRCAQHGEKQDDRKRLAPRHNHGRPRRILEDLNAGGPPLLG